MSERAAPPKTGWKTRGAVSNWEGRFQNFRREAVYDGWYRDDEQEAPAVHRTVMPDKARSIITYNTSPDIPFDRSINPYRGCEHGCIYCFARPTHSYLDLSPGLDFETQLFYKEDAPAMLERELSKPTYRCRSIALGINTDAYQPVERELGLTRRLLEVLLEYRHPVSLITKSRLILRDLDILSEMARHNLIWSAVSVTSRRQTIKSTLEPRTASPNQRLGVIEQLSGAGVPVSVMVAPVIPAITDHELESLLEDAYAAGAVSAGYVLPRLPHEIAPLFGEWLERHYPDRAAHVMSLMRQSHKGEAYNSEWGTRMRGEGVYADLLEQRFRKACRRLGFERRESIELDTSQFRVPVRSGDQMGFDL